MPKDQLHKRFSTEQVKLILDWYEDRALSADEARERLSLGERRFFALLAAYRKDKNAFTVGYPKRAAHNRLEKETDDAIRAELEREKKLIENKALPIRTYNYAAVRDAVAKSIDGPLSGQVVRNRARAWGFVIAQLKDKRAHDRIVLTSAVGQLFQHDSSHHLWSPYAAEKWALLATLDDYSRKLLFADFYETETAWAHIEAAESVILNYGAGLAYYVDNHAIFRFVCYRDSMWYDLVKGTDDVTTQWKAAVEAAGMKVFYASSPEGKGKIERPYRWLQDRIVRRCAKEGIKTIADARIILRDEVERYNARQVHSTTKEIPDIRFERAIAEGKSVLRPFALPQPYTSTKDIFCLKEKRVVDGYHKIAWRKHKIPVPKDIPEGAEIELHVRPDPESPEVRLWYHDKVILVAKLQPRRNSLSS